MGEPKQPPTRPQTDAAGAVLNKMQKGFWYACFAGQLFARASTAFAAKDNQVQVHGCSRRERAGEPAGRLPTQLSGARLNSFSNG